MCCDLCDYYFNCEEMEQVKTLCCSKCEEMQDCYGELSAGQRFIEDDEDLDDLDDDDLDDEEEEEEEEEEEFGYEEGYDDDEYGLDDDVIEVDYTPANKRHH